VRLAALAFCLALASAAGAQQPPSWQAVVGDLAAERTRAETCVSLLKRHAPDAAALSRGQLAYAGAKAQMDAIIAELAIVVVEGGGPKAVPDLGARLDATLAARRDFCAGVVEIVPADEGTRTVLANVLAMAEGLIDGVFALIRDARQEERLVRDTIRIQLEAQRWPAFAAVAP